MAHVLRLSEWESNGKYYVSDVTDLARGSGTWWYVSNLLSLSPVDYVKMLIDKFHATGLRYNINSDVLIFYFTSLKDARNYKNFVNKIAREKKFIICA